MTKRKTRRKTNKRKPNKKQNLNFKLLNLLLVIIVLVLTIIILILFIFDTRKLKESKNIQKNIEKKITLIEQKTKKEFDNYTNDIKIKKDKFEEYTKDFYEEYMEKSVKKHPKQEIKEEEKTQTVKKMVEEKKEKPVFIDKKPKLAIVIDDVTTSYQVKQIKSIGFTTTMSFMPPTKRHQNSASIAHDLPFYMIHFPLEARYFKNEEYNTLHINDSYEKIEKRVAQIRLWYPTAIYTNNHTGSKFTSNKEAMDKLFKALKKYNFIFVDSRTTGKSVAKEMAHKYEMPYIARNVFLDNEQNIPYIQNQLKKAIRIAKKNGYAIAICHPHSATIKALKQSKHLLEDLQLVYLNQLPIL